MPSESRKQHNLMEARAHGATFPEAKKIPLAVAKEFAMADLGRKFGGPHKAEPVRKTVPRKGKRR